MNRCLALTEPGSSFPLCLVSRRNNGNAQPCQEFVVCTVFVHPPVPSENELVKLVNSPDCKRQKKRDWCGFALCQLNWQKTLKTNNVHMREYQCLYSLNEIFKLLTFCLAFFSLDVDVKMCLWYIYSKVYLHFHTSLSVKKVLKSTMTELRNLHLMFFMLWDMK